jgi:hypothetical protein
MLTCRGKRSAPVVSVLRQATKRHYALAGFDRARLGAGQPHMFLIACNVREMRAFEINELSVHRHSVYPPGSATNESEGDMFRRVSRP